MRAQARAIHHVAVLTYPSKAEGEAAGAAYLERELAFADTLEQQGAAP